MNPTRSACLILGIVKTSPWKVWISAKFVRLDPTATTPVEARSVSDSVDFTQFRPEALLGLARSGR